MGHIRQSHNTVYRKGANDMSLYVASMGKMLEITAIVKGDDNDANEYMEYHTDDALIAIQGDLYFMANKYDKGA